MKALKKVPRPSFERSRGSMLAEEPLTELQCDNCGYVGDLDAFHTMSKCLTCHRDKDIPAIHGLDGKRILRDRDVVAKLSSAILGKTVKAKTGYRINEISDALMEEFGGPTDFARSWYYVIQEAKLRDPGGYSVMRAHEQISKLVLDVNKMDGEEEVAQAMDDKKLEKEITQILLQRIRDGEVDLDSLLNGTAAIEHVTKDEPAAEASQMSDDDLLAATDDLKEELDEASKE